MPLFGAESIYHYIKQYKVCWIKGGLGSYKTSLAFRLAYDLLSDKSANIRYLTSNIPNAWNTLCSQIYLDDEDQLNTISIIDEGGLVLKRSEDADDTTKALRKVNLQIIIPSNKAPAYSLRFLYVQRVFNYQILGLPLLQYRYTLRDGDNKEGGTFWWLNPWEIFGIYHTKAFALTDAGLSVRLGRVIDYIVEKTAIEEEESGLLEIFSERDPRRGWRPKRARKPKRERANGVPDLEEITGQLIDTAEEAAAATRALPIYRHQRHF